MSLRRPNPIVHGTAKGYQRCRKLAGGACDPCKEAHAVQMQRYRDAGAPWVARERNRTIARSRALERLRTNHQAEFDELLLVEAVALGVFDELHDDEDRAAS